MYLEVHSSGHQSLYAIPQEKWANATLASQTAVMSLSFPSLQLYSLIAVGLLRYFIQWNAHWKQEHLPSWGHFVSPCRSWPLPLYWWDFKIKTSFSKPQADVLAWLTLALNFFSILASLLWLEDEANMQSWFWRHTEFFYPKNVGIAQ